MEQRKSAFPGLDTYPDQEKALKIGAWVVSIVVIALVVFMRRFKLPVPDGWDVSFLPAVNATINAMTAVALLFSLYFVKTKNYVAHRNANATALALSVLFLACYVGYHFTTPEVIYGDADGNGIISDAESLLIGSSRTVYLVILLSHIALAGVLLPFILFTTIRAMVGKYTMHKKMARYVWPLWFYVAVTGPVVYLMLRPYYA